MRVAFMGTPEFAAASLRALIDAPEHEVVCVVSQPDRPFGRKNRMKRPEVAVVADEMGIPLLQTDTARTRGFRQWVARHEPEITVVAAFGHILGPKALSIAPRGSINVHASLLPRWRGASPIQAAIVAGDVETGVTIMQMDRGLDTGDMLTVSRCAIEPEETAASLHDKLMGLGAKALLECLAGLAAGAIEPEPQPEEGVTYAGQLTREDGRLDWTRPARALDCQVRGLHPWPGTFTELGGERLKVFPRVEVLSGSPGEPGTVLAASSEGIDVACGEGALRLTRLQLPGRKPLDSEAFLAGVELAPGDRLG